MYHVRTIPSTTTPPPHGLHVTAYRRLRYFVCRYAAKHNTDSTATAACYQLLIPNANTALLRATLATQHAARSRSRNIDTGTGCVVAALRCVL